MKYYGKYSAKVVKVNGSKIKVKCTAIYGEYESPWCTPCVPIVKSASTLRMPKVSEKVWIEFEEGNPQKPIWVGTMTM